MSKVLNKLKHKFKFKNFKQTYTTTMSSVSANTFPDFFKSLASLAKSNMPSPKELQTKKFAKAKRAKIIAKQRIVQAKIDKKTANKQAKIDKKEADKQAKIDKKEADKQAKKHAKIAQKMAEKEANTPETNNDDFLNTLFKLAKTNMPSPKELQTKKFAKAKRAKIISKQRAKEAQKQAKIAQKEEKKLIVKAKKTLAKADKILEAQEREDLVDTIMKQLGPNVGNTSSMPPTLSPTLKEWDNEYLVDDDNYLYDVTDRKKIGKVVDVDNSVIEFFD